MQPTRQRRLHLESLETRRMLATFTVTSLADSGEGSLREAVSLSNELEGTDTILFDESLNGQTISLSTGQIEIADLVTISASILDAGIVIDASASDPTPEINDGMGSRIFVVNRSGQGSVEFNNLTLEGGDVTGNGGAILANGVRIVDSIVRDSHATGDGGGISSSGQLINSQVTGNLAGGNGGGISAYGLTLIDVSIRANRATDGGGIWTGGSSGHFSFTNVQLEENQATGDGGGFAIEGREYSYGFRIEFTDLTVTGNRAGGNGGGILGEFNTRFTGSGGKITNNHAEGSGGGVRFESAPSNDRPSFSLSNSTISGNSADVSGGGISVSQKKGNAQFSRITAYGNHAKLNGGGMSLSTLGGRIDVVQSTISGNTSERRGGGIFATTFYDSLASFPRIEISQSTIADNATYSDVPEAVGGGLAVGDSHFDISVTSYNSIIARNHKIAGNERIADDVQGDDFTANHSLFQTVDDATVLFGNNNMSIGVDPMLGPLADNGSGILTHLLQEGSPAIDAGNPELWEEEYIYDQRGTPFSRMRDGNRDGVVQVDMGATERIGDAPPVVEIAPLSRMPRVNETATIDASASFDPDMSTGDLFFTWTINSTASETASAEIPDPTASVIEFTGTELGSYELQLDVHDGVETSTSILTVMVVENQPPDIQLEVSAGPYFAGDTIQFDVSGTTDTESDQVTYRFFPDQLFEIDADNPAIGTIVFESPGTKIIHIFADDPRDRDVLRLEIEVLDVGFSWNNTINSADINADGVIAPLDALLVINELGERQYSDDATGRFLLRRPDQVGFLDADNNQLVSPLDALHVINELNSSQSEDSRQFAPVKGSRNGERWRSNDDHDDELKNRLIEQIFRVDQ